MIITAWREFIQNLQNYLEQLDSAATALSISLYLPKQACFSPKHIMGCAPFTPKRRVHPLRTTRSACKLAALLQVIRQKQVIGVKAGIQQLTLFYGRKSNFLLSNDQIQKFYASDTICRQVYLKDDLCSRSESQMTIKGEQQCRDLLPNKTCPVLKSSQHRQLLTY